ncbi:NF038130 family PEP-CTERM protein [Nostoc sp. LPT]|uniref:NF038130 family PEP-CTERM protein n=1 Tax=Nostoc sp. LPT TaxID=2815387 RepID=UPI001DBEBCEE|nr:NF038130 family PEP-CTERM protein [Nostoc sp. LPT]MBN4002998.1 PEP-CTERM sorting domain-containing protein [Nostoc sp. LPT]
MKMTFQKLVIGASMAVGVSVATAPAHATSFSFNNPNEIKTYTGGSNGKFIANDTVAASKALSDANLSSNVELWYTDENPTSNVGFTATQGNYSATVSSVTANDWNSFGSQWLGDLLNSYTPFKTVWNGFSASTQSLVASYFPLLGMGDPNIGSFQFGQNGGVELTLVGHLDVKTKLSDTLSTKLNDAWNGVGTTPGVKLLFPSTKIGLPTTLEVQTQISTLKLALNSPLTPAAKKATLSTQITQLTSFKDVLSLQATLKTYQGEIGASEIAKVVTGGKTSYAYSFNPTASGITASDDGISYSAYYTWHTSGYTAPPKRVPEPSIILGLLGVTGVFVTQRKFKKASI